MQIFNGVANDLDEHNTNKFLLLQQKPKILREGIYLKYFTHKKLWKLKLDVLCSPLFYEILYALVSSRNPYIHKRISNKFIFYVQQLKLKVLSSISVEKYLTRIPIRAIYLRLLLFSKLNNERTIPNSSAMRLHEIILN